MLLLQQVDLTAGQETAHAGELARTLRACLHELTRFLSGLVSTVPGMSPVCGGTHAVTCGLRRSCLPAAKVSGQIAKLG